MVDTVRPLATLQNLLADNSAGDISAQDVRDMLVSIWINTQPFWTDIDHMQGQTVRRADGNVYQANDAIPAGTGFTVGTTGATWSVVVDGSGKFPTVAENFLLTVDGTGTPIATTVEQMTDSVRSGMQLQTSRIQLSNFLAVAQGAILGFEDRASGRMFLPVATELDANGTSRPVFPSLAAITPTFTQSDTSITIAAASAQHQFSNVNVGEGTATEYVITRPAGAATAANCNLIIRLNSHTDPNPVVDYKRDHPQGSGFDMGPGDNSITLPSPAFFSAGVTVFVTIVSDDGDNLNMLGANLDLGAGTQEIPAGSVLGRLGGPAGVALQSEVRSDEQIQDLVAAMFTGGTHNGITVTYTDNDENDGVINLTVTGGTPQPGPSVSDFTINIPSTVNVGTDLNDQRTIAFDTVQTAQIASLDLVITTGTDQNITPLPTTDGSHSRQVTLAGIDTSAAGTVVFQIRGTTTGGQTIMSNSVTITIRAVSADEQAYYGTRATNDFATVNTSLLTAVDVQPPGSQYTISGSWPAGHTIGILEPTDRPITSIIETAFNQETLSLWARTASARTIGGQTYDLLTQVNNGPSGTFEFRVTHG